MIYIIYKIYRNELCKYFRDINLNFILNTRKTGLLGH